MIFGKPVVCPACNMEFILSEIYEKGDNIACTNCRVKLTVISINPPVLNIIKSSKESKNTAKH
ncbi:MAG: hypothetical protein JXJ19_10350 [Elusimicrobia bacterium]|nr:hypothetical protein [Elusimicrobiota bacterium]